MNSGWVPDSGIAAFTVESMNDKFSMKKFRSDKDYRAAVIECVRIVTAAGDVFPDTIMKACAQYEEVNLLICCYGKCISCYFIYRSFHYGPH